MKKNTKKRIELSVPLPLLEKIDRVHSLQKNGKKQTRNEFLVRVIEDQLKENQLTLNQKVDFAIEKIGRIEDQIIEQGDSVPFQIYEKAIREIATLVTVLRS